MAKAKSWFNRNSVQNVTTRMAGLPVVNRSGASEAMPKPKETKNEDGQRYFIVGESEIEGYEEEVVE